MSNELEHELTRVLGRRADLVQSTPSYRVRPDAAPAGGRTQSVVRRLFGPRLRLVVSVAAVGAVFALAATALIKSRPDPHRAVSTEIARCTSTGSGPFAEAMRHDRLPAGSTVLSGAADGTLLVARTRAGATTGLELIDAADTTRTIWTAAPDGRVQVVANPFNAISRTSVVFVVRPLDRAGAARAVFVLRDSGSSGTLIPDRGYQVGTDPVTAPSSADDAVRVVERSTSRPADIRVALYWTDVDLRTPDGSSPSPGVRTLLVVGGNTIMIRTIANGQVEPVFDQPGYRPSTLAGPARHGFGFVTDGQTLRWLTSTGAGAYVWRWAVGDPEPRGVLLSSAYAWSAIVGRFVTDQATTSGQHVLDTRTGRVIQLPPHLTLRRADGDSVVVSEPSGAGTRDARIPVSDLMTC